MKWVSSVQCAYCLGLTILCRLCYLKTLQHSSLELVLVHLDTGMYVHALVQLDRGERRQDKTPRLCSMCPCSMTSVQCLLLGWLNKEEEGRHCEAFLAFASQCRIPGGQHALSPLCLPLIRRVRLNFDTSMHPRLPSSPLHTTQHCIELLATYCLWPVKCFVRV